MHAVAVPLGALRNVARAYGAEPYVRCHTVTYEAKDDPDAFPDDESMDHAWLYRPKIGGTPAFANDIPARGRFLFVLSEEPADLNLAGVDLTVFVTERGELGAALT